MYELWVSFDLTIAMMIFVAHCIIDALYALYTLFVVDKRPFASASIGALMHFLLAFGVINYVQNFLYVIPLAIGSFCGTYVVVRYEKNKKPSFL